MSFLDLARERYSVRKFEQKPVEIEVIGEILEAARVAPTAKNAQPERILVIHRMEALERLKGCTPCHYHAPLAFLICYDCERCYKRELDGQSSGEIDATIVGTHMMLQAASIGLGSTWVMNFDPEKMRAEFHIPEWIKPAALLVCGYPSADSRPSSRHLQSVGLEEICRFDDFAETSTAE